jgi:hypothetical protein
MSINERDEVGRAAPVGRFLGPVRALAMIAALAGAWGSVSLMLRVGQRNHSIILLVMFGIWVLSPFISLTLAALAAKRWSVLMRKTLYIVMLVLTLGSLVVYAEVAFGPPRAQPASLFLFVPFASWLLITVVFPLTAFISRRSSENLDLGVKRR